jgi:hypothetical protein
LYFLTHFLKLYAIRFEQQRFTILSYARNPCPEAVWINPDPHFSDFEVVIWFWHGYPPINIRPFSTVPERVISEDRA